MSTSTTERKVDSSPRSLARAAGFFWLLTIVTGSFALVGDRLIVAGNAAVTAANILAHESSFRFGLVANLSANVCYLAATVLVYYLLKPVNRKVSLLAAFFSLAACAIAGLGFVFYLAPLLVLDGAQYLSVFTIEQLQALAFMLVRLRGPVFYISHVFFGLHCLLVGCLIFKSTFLPRIVGALMVFAGLGWLTMSFGNLLSPPFGRTLDPYILAPGVIGEFSLTLWLLVMSVNAQRWQAAHQPPAAAAWRSPEQAGAATLSHN